MLLGCLFGRQNNQHHTLTVCSSGAKGAESREQKGHPRHCSCVAATSHGSLVRGCLRHLHTWAAWKVAWSGSQPR